MRISEVCKRTGLTERTVRFYVEKGLLKKDAQFINGRNCRDYTEYDIEILKDIMVLRNVGFSIQNILDMQESSEGIKDIIFEKYCSLKEEKAKYEQSFTLLEQVKERKDLTWRGMANIFRNTAEKNPKDIVFHWPEEILENEDTNKKDNWKRNNYSFFRLIMGTLIISCILYSIFYCVQYNKKIVTIISLSDVIIHEKWLESGEMYAVISCNQENAIGYDFYFEETRTVKIEDAKLYEMAVCESVTYQSVNLVWEMRCGEAKKYDLLESIRANTINLEKGLENKDWIRSYCSINRILPK